MPFHSSKDSKKSNPMKGKNEPATVTVEPAKEPATEDTKPPEMVLETPASPPQPADRSVAPPPALTQVESAQSTVSPKNPSQSSPHITAVSPPHAPVGATVVISGSGFGDFQERVLGQVSFGAGLPIKEWSDTKISITVPNDAQSGDLTVTADGRSASVDFIVDQTPVLPVKQNPTK